MAAQLHTIADFIRYSFTRLNSSDVYFGHGTDNAWDEAVALVLQTLSLPWDFDRELWACRVTDEEILRLTKNLNARIDQRIPLAYLTNKAYFCGLEFYVDDRVLVPRSPLAQLIENGFSPWLLDEPQRIMDLCTGSGCIGIASALLFEEAQVDLLDISEDALEVCNKNISKFALQDRVTAMKSDCFSALSERDHHTYDLIVSNPPYVDAEDIGSMPDEYRKEPMLGLASGNDGLDFTREMLRQAASYLSPSGVLIAEVGNSWVALEEAYPELEFTWIEFEHGGHGVFMLTADQLQAVKE
ncbi:ribosomal protein L3 N(5)-glutamine methyltransferase [Oleiphilus sp. HI0009]|uniref:50S ribosomal protein L3 N(5)-glutamine methyltransferase n=1 Tax=unclassified Oleiphilus TaxID=2631174 RepID=UPI0007C31D47